MVQKLYVDINENNDSGTDLANILDDASASIRTDHSGEDRPDYILPGMSWTKIPDATDPSVGPWEVMKFDGTNDIVLYTVDPQTHTALFGGNNERAGYTVARTDNLKDILEIFRSINSLSSQSLFFSQLNDNNIVKAFSRIKSISTNVANNAESADLVFEVAKAGVLTQVVKFLSTGAMQVSSLAGVGHRKAVVSPQGELKARDINYSTETQYFKDETIIKDNAMYVALNDFTSNELDFSLDLPNLKLIGKDYDALIAALDFGYNTTALQSLANSGTITISSKKMQICEIDSSAANISISATPFGVDPENFTNGMIITVICVDENMELTLPVSDVDYGYVGNGDIVFKKGVLFEFLYNATLKRFLKKSSNI